MMSDNVTSFSSAGSDRHYFDSDQTGMLKTLLIFVFLTLVAAIGGQVQVQVQGQEADPQSTTDPQTGDTKMGSFAKLISGQWKVTAASGKSMYHRWHWGPGKHSIRRETSGQGAGGQAWRELMVFYWHPIRKEICMKGFSPYAQGLSEGTMAFDGENGDGRNALFQTGHRREMGVSWKFDGPNRFREKLLESVGKEGLKTLVEFDHDRVPMHSEDVPADVDEEVPPSEHLKLLVPFLGGNWDAKGEWIGRAFHIRTTIRRIPLAEVIFFQAMAIDPNGGSTHLFDGYVYRHTDAKELRCLLLSSDGCIYEGQVAVLGEDALQVDLQSCEQDKTRRYIVRLELAAGDSMRQRVWLHEDSDGQPILDIEHKR